MSSPPPHLPAPLFDAETIAIRVRELGTEIRSHYPEGSITLLSILKGSALFTADLARSVPGEVELSFVHARSYGDRTTSSGTVELFQLEHEVLAGRRVVVVDTILDTGRTLEEVVRSVKAAGAADVRTCVLLDKKARRQVDVVPDWIGFETPDLFLVGYGLDHAGRYRTLAYIGALDGGALEGGALDEGTPHE
ncbi:MAG: hypoxanthine phosphoribosyltransferase [Planctomycetota bacterium]